jgi:hypothetical protein
MAIEYAGADVYHATITVVDDSDPPTAASFAAGIQDLADRTANLKVAATGHTNLTAALVPIVPGLSDGEDFPLTFGRESLVYVTNSSAVSEFEPKGFGFPYQVACVTEPTGTEEIWLALTPALQKMVQLKYALWYVNPSGWDTVPSAQLKIEIRERVLGSATIATLGTATEAAPADAAAMNAARPIAYSGAAINIVAGRQYFAVLVMPAGGSGLGRSVVVDGLKVGTGGAP